MVTVGPGRQVGTLDLVNRLRRFRGRMTLRELCEALDYGAENAQALRVIKRLCRDYAINVARQPRRGPLAPAPGPHPAMAAEARRALAAEVAAHHRRLRTGTVAPYKPGPLEW